MSKREQEDIMNARTREELEAVDLAMCGGAVAREHAPMAELTRALRVQRPRMGEDFARALDTRAAAGFARRSRRPEPLLRPRDARPRARRAEGRGWPRAPLRSGLAPRLGVGLALAVAVVLAVVVGSVPGPAPRSAPRVVGAPSAGSPRAGTKADLAGASGSTSGSPAGAPGAAGSASAARQVERTATLEVGVPNGAVESTAQRVFTLVSVFGGYIRQSNVSSGSVGTGGASFEIRVPSAGLAGAIAALSHLGRVRSETDTTSDVSEAFEGLRRELGDLQAQRRSVLRQLAAATEAASMARLQGELRSIEARIGRQQAALGALSRRVDYTTVALSLSGEASGTGVAGSDLTPGGAARAGSRILAAALAVLVLGTAALAPPAAIVLAGWGLFVLTRRRRREQALDAASP